MWDKRKKQLGTRLKEHMLDIRKKNGLLSVVSNHRLEYNHDMNWNEAAILDIESSYVKRIVSEMVYIKRQCKGLKVIRTCCRMRIFQSLTSFLLLKKTLLVVFYSFPL